MATWNRQAHDRITTGASLRELMARLGHSSTRAPDGMVRYTAHELRRVCASLLIASGASDMQVAHQVGHSKVETTKNIYGHLFGWDRSAVLDAMNQAVSRLHAYELSDGETAAA